MLLPLTHYFRSIYSLFSAGYSGRAMKQVLMLLMLSTFFALPASALTARQLREKCLADRRVMVASDTNDVQHVKADDWQDASYCIGYIDGATDAANGLKLDDGRMVVIATGQTTFREMAEMFLQWTDANPADLDKSADVGVIGALLVNKKATLTTGNLKVTGN
jgi:hypothetical protein